MSTSSSWDGKTKGGLIGYKLFIYVLKFFGITAAYFVLRFVALYFLIFSRKSTQSNFFYFKEILSYPFWRTIKSIYICYYKFGQTILDKVAVLSGFQKKFSYESFGVENLYKLVDQGQGALLISAHLGNWEIAGSFLYDKLKVPINIVLFDGEHERIKNMLNDSMVDRNFKIIPIKSDFSHLFLINKAIKNKELICIHGDRFMDDSKSKTVEMDFMGRPAKFPIGPFSLASRLKIPYSFVYGMKSTKYHYNFYASEAVVHTDEPETILSAYVKSLEKMVMKYPTQWFNYYDFWSTEKKIDA